MGMSFIDRIFGNICIPVDRLQEVVDRMDYNGDGLIQLSEFITCLRDYKDMALKTAKATGTAPPAREIPKRRH